jgi:hypothetical protein
VILAASEKSNRRGWARHLEGWQAGFLAVLVALTAALIVVPRGVDPVEVPLPVTDAGALRAALARDRTLATELGPALEREIANPTAAGPGLYDLRAVGETFRLYGTAEATADTAAVLRARQNLIRAALRARALGDQKLLALRAYQQRIFLNEVSRWERTRAESTELVEIAGPSVRLVSQHGWSDARGRLAMSEPLRAVFFKRRWSEVTGLSEPPFALTLQETRAFYAFLLSHPWVDREMSQNPKAACVAADQWRLRKIEELSGRDRAFPRQLARGVILFRLGDYPGAAQAFRDHLDSGRDPSYALRARNYLVAANARAEQTP